jgi:cellulose synthase/poly-beta-1,6-N-acetylglucosamine synthase-like glycosyltransferase
MSVLEGLLIGAAVVLAIPTCVLLGQVLLAMPAHRKREIPDGRHPRVAVLVPAHDEALVIGETLRRVREQLASGDRLLVVADNCSDDTATLATEAGAEVVERFDARHRGKGYALDFGVNALRADPPEVLVIVDADCDVGPGAIERIARVSRDSGRPVQALYLMRAPSNAGIGRKVSELAWLVKNYVRPLGGHRIGMPCQLMGTGMAFPWESVHVASLATGHIAEDVLFGINLARAGTPPLFCPDALVTSEFAASEIGARSQRQRWEHGNLGLIVSHAPRLFALGVSRRDARLLGLALDLAVPPLALLTLAVAVLVLVSAVVAYLSTIVKPLVVSTAVMASLVTAVVSSWARYGRGIVSLGQLAFAPIYALRKIPMYVGFLTRRQVEWVRTRRGR